MSGVIVVTLLALTQVFIYLPNAVLSAIIINAVMGLGQWNPQPAE